MSANFLKIGQCAWQFFSVGQISVFFPPKKMGNFHKCFFLSVNVINFAKLLEKIAKIFNIKRLRKFYYLKLI